MLTIIKPPSSLPIKTITKHHTIIFLAGSIEMGLAKDWQKLTENAFTKVDPSVAITILNPRRDDWDSSWEQSIDNPNFKFQVEWEINGLKLSDKILMYFDPNTMAPITLLELGLFADPQKLLVCCPKGFWKKGNVDVVCNMYGIQQVDSFEEMIEESLSWFKPKNNYEDLT